MRVSGAISQSAISGHLKPAVGHGPPEAFGVPRGHPSRATCRSARAAQEQAASFGALIWAVAAISSMGFYGVAVELSWLSLALALAAHGPMAVCDVTD
jgi:hypothetical protein